VIEFGVFLMLCFLRRSGFVFLVLPLRYDNGVCVDLGDGVDFVTTYRLNSSFELRQVLSCLSGVCDKPLLTGVFVVVTVGNPSRLVRYFHYFTVKTLQDLCRVHHVRCAHPLKIRLETLLRDHVCTDACPLSSYLIFSARRFRRQRPALFVGLGESVSAASRRGKGVGEDKIVNVVEGLDEFGKGRTAIGAGPACTVSASTRVEASEQVDQSQGDFPYLSNQAARYDIIREWQSVMDPDAWKLNPCAVCGQCKYDNVLVHARELPLHLLQNPWLPEDVIPKSYNWEGYDRAILYPLALRDRKQKGELDVCASCLRDMKGAGRQPLDSLANFQYFGMDELPDEVRGAFEQASMFDVMLVSRARATRITHLFSSTKESLCRGGDPEISQRFNRGNAAILTQDNVRLREVLPPARDEVAEAMCALFIGGLVRPTRQNIAGLKPVLVSKKNVSVMLDFLLSRNRWYRSSGVVFSQKNMEAIFDGRNPSDGSDVPAGVEIYHLPDDDNVRRTETDYTGRTDSIDQEDGDLVMEAVGYVTGDRSPQNYRIMKAGALAWCLDRKRFLKSCTGSDFVHDQDPFFLSALFPHLDPWGIGGFNVPERTPEQRLSLERQLRNLLRQHNSPFQKDASFAFVCWNLLQRLEVNRHGSFRVRESMKATIVKDIKDVSPCLTDLMVKWNVDPHAQPSTDTEKKAFQVLSKLHFLVRDLKGSVGYKQCRRNEIRALIKRFGTPALFVTLNPCDIQHVLVGVFGGLTAEQWRGMTVRDRAKFVATHPGAAAQLFDVMISKFLSVVVRFRKGEPGLFGTCEAYYGMVEAQGRGTLHCHMLLWLKGNLSPQALRDRMSEDCSFASSVITWLESIIHCHLPGMTEPLRETPQTPLLPPPMPPGHMDPRLAKQPILLEDNSHEFEAAFRSFVSDLAVACNWHVHTSTCWKHLKPGEPRDDAHCRMRIDGTTRSMTEIDPETQSLLLRRLHPRINNFNDLVLFLVQCNMDIKFIGSGQAAKALVFYISDYITKNSLAFHVGFSAIQHAIKQNGLKFSGQIEPPLSVVDKSLYVKTVNSIMARQEMSHQQVMSYLVGGGDFYASHSFRLLRWGDFDRYVAHEERELLGRDDGRADYLYDEDDVSLDQDESDIVGCRESGDDVTLQTSDTDVSVKNDVLDYVYRPDVEEMRMMPLWTYTERYCKLPATQDLARVANRKCNRGKKAGIRGRFASTDHPLFDTHLVRLRGKEHAYVPVLLGRALPRPDRSEEERELWCRAMLILFKPWRRLFDLKEKESSWSRAYDDFAFDPYCRRIINNMNVENECKDAKRAFDDNLFGNREDASSLAHVQGLWTEDTLTLESSLLNDKALDGHDEDDEFDRSDEHGEDNPDFDAQVLNAHEKAGAEVLQAIETTGLFHAIARTDVQLMERRFSDTSEITDADARLMRAHAAWLKEQRQNKRPAFTQLSEDEATRNGQGPVEPTLAVSSLGEPLSSASRAKNGNVSFDIRRMMEHVILDFGLDSNVEQQRAFRLVGSHFGESSPDQLLLHIGGMAGTGKSHVIKAIVALFKRCGRSESLLLSAPTGCAAVLIGGHTIHSLTLLPSSKKVDLKVLEGVWRHVRYLIIDEISMVGATLLSQISRRISCARGWDQKASERPFGGINVIFTGDFGQLRPVLALPLYSHSLVGSLSENIVQTEHGQYALHGASVWRQISKVVELKINQRAIGDPAFTDLLRRIRAGKVWDGVSIMDDDQKGDGNNYVCNDFLTLQSRQLCRLPKCEVQRFAEAPVIVSTKAVRDALNLYLTRLYGAKCGREVNVYYSEDRFERKPLEDDVQARLWRVSSTVANDALGRLPLFPGQKVMVTENVAISFGVVNGTEGIIEDVRYRMDTEGRRFGVCAYVRVLGAGLISDELGKDIVPIMPTSSSFRYTGNKGEKYSISRSQFPLLPAYSFTDYKSQGRTLPLVLLDLTECRSLQSLYVMLSRATTLRNLAIVRWFSPSKIFDQRLSEECRNEFRRLHQLHLTTLAEFEASPTSP
jgi:Helitron helicase-like domain at N-terminus/PIF1-like helicase